MIKIQRIKKDTQREDRSVVTRELIKVVINDFNIDQKYMNLIEKKYQNVTLGHYNNIFFIGFECTANAKCSPEDVFSFRIGKVISERRCWNKAKNKTSRILKDILNLQELKIKEMRDFNANIVYDNMEKVIAEFYNNSQEV